MRRQASCVMDVVVPCSMLTSLIYALLSVQLFIDPSEGLQPHNTYNTPPPTQQQHPPLHSGTTTTLHNNNHNNHNNIQDDVAKPIVLNCELQFEMKFCTADVAGREDYLLQSLMTWFQSDGGNGTNSIHFYSSNSGFPTSLHTSPELQKFRSTFHFYPIDTMLPKRARVSQHLLYNRIRAAIDESSQNHPPNRFSYEVRIGADVAKEDRTCEKFGAPNGLLLLEDDVLFSKHVMAKLVDILLQIEDDLRNDRPAAVKATPYAVTMYSWMDVRRGVDKATRKAIVKRRRMKYRGIQYFHRPGFSHSQALYITQAAIPHFVEILKKAYDDEMFHIDMATGRGQSNGTFVIYRPATVSMVQHIGSSSTRHNRTLQHLDPLFDIENK